MNKYRISPKDILPHPFNRLELLLLYIRIAISITDIDSDFSILYFIDLNPKLIIVSHVVVSFYPVAADMVFCVFGLTQSRGIING